MTIASIQNKISLCIPYSLKSPCFLNYIHVLEFPFVFNEARISFTTNSILCMLFALLSKAILGWLSACHISLPENVTF